MTDNGTGHMYLVDSIRPYRDQIRHGLGLLDGNKYWSYSLWKAPEGVAFDDIDFSTPEPRFMQSAGTGTALAIEVRFVEADGAERQYCVGHPGTDYSGEPSVPIFNEVKIYPGEVFDADEAADIYYQYFLTGRVPEPYLLRWLDFSAYEDN
ncbi:hypothetical protein ACL9RE_13035 [Mycetocola saprophilus]